MTEEPDIRVGDSEREAAAAALGEHFAAGRLTHLEYDQRSDRVWSAKVWSDLEALFADLPEPRVSRVAAPRPGQHPGGPYPTGPSHPLGRFGRFGPLTIALPLLVLALIAITLVGWGHGPWPLLLLVWFWFVGFPGRARARNRQRYRSGYESRDRGTDRHD